MRSDSRSEWALAVSKHERMGGRDHCRWKEAKKWKSWREGGKEGDKVLLRWRDGGGATFSRWLLEITANTYKWVGWAETERRCGKWNQAYRLCKVTVLSPTSSFSPANQNQTDTHAAVCLWALCHSWWTLRGEDIKCEHLDNSIPAPKWLLGP